MLHTDAERRSRRPVPPTARQPAARPDPPVPPATTPRPAPATWSPGSTEPAGPADLHQLPDSGGSWQLPGDERSLAAARARRLVAARRWERRAELATRRAARASSSLV